MASDIKICGCCLQEVKHLYVAACSYKPEGYYALPIGMFHCPDCSGMLLAGTEHPPVCCRCWFKGLLNRNNI